MQGRISALAMPRAGRPACHAYLTDGGERLYHPEHTLVGILGCLVLVSLASGVWLWLRRRAIFRLRYFWPRNTESRYLLRGHAAQGATLGLLFAGLVVTGVAMVFPGPFHSSLNTLLGAQPPLAPSVASAEAGAGHTDWQQVLDVAGEAFPAAVVRFVSPPRQSDALYPLHAGKTGWPGYRLFLTLVSFSLLFMALSGLRLMLGRLRLRTGASRRALARCS